MKDWIPDTVWLSIMALSEMDAFKDLPDLVYRGEAAWRHWYDAEAPERAAVPALEDHLSKFQRMCVIRVRFLICKAYLSRQGRNWEYYTHKAQNFSAASLQECYYGCIRKLSEFNNINLLSNGVFSACCCRDRLVEQEMSMYMKGKYVAQYLLL